MKPNHKKCVLCSCQLSGTIAESFSNGNRIHANRRLSEVCWNLTWQGRAEGQTKEAGVDGYFGDCHNAQKSPHEIAQPAVGKQRGE